MNRPHTLQCAARCLAMLAALFVTSVAFAQATRPPEAGGEPGQGNLERALLLLKAEAAEARATFALPHCVSDFADRFDGTLTDEEVRGLLRAPIVQDSFVDTYIRWQILSFNVTLGTFSDEEFETFIRQAPELMNNPKATMRTLRFARAMNTRRTLEPTDYTPVGERVEHLNWQADLIKTFRIPADEFWAWVYEQLDEHTPRRTQWIFARLTATIRAGWPIAELSLQFTEHLESTVDETPVPELLSLPQRVQMARRIRTVAEGQRDYITELKVSDDHVFTAEIHSTGVSKEDADRWVDLLKSAKAD